MRLRVQPFHLPELERSCPLCTLPSWVLPSCPWERREALLAGLSVDSVCMQEETSACFPMCTALGPKAQRKGGLCWDSLGNSADRRTFAGLSLLGCWEAVRRGQGPWVGPSSAFSPGRYFMTLRDIVKWRMVPSSSG